MPASVICRHNSKAPKTALRSRVTATSVQEFNVTVRSFPSDLTAMMFGFKTKPNFTVENETEIAKPPKVDFGPVPAKPQGEAQGVAK